MNDSSSQQHGKEEKSATSTIVAESSGMVQNVQEANSSSRPDETQLDRIQFSKLSSHGYNTTFGAIEKSFKPEEYVYVRSFFSPLNLRNNCYLYNRLNLKKTNEIQSISLEARNGPLQRLHVLVHI